MSKAIIILSILVLVLLATSSIYMGKAATYKAEVEEAESLAKTTKSLLRANGITCRARDSDVSGIRACITPALIGLNFKIEQMSNFDERRNETGALILVNQGENIYDGTMFSLKKNGVLVASECHITGEILPDYTCRFPITELCEDGDVLEVTYTQSIDGEERSDGSRRRRVDSCVYAWRTF